MKRTISLILLSLVFIFSLFMGCSPKESSSENLVLHVVSEQDKEYVFNTDTAVLSNYFSSSKLSEFGFEGEYTGNAIGFFAGNRYQSSGYTVKPKITLEQYEKLKRDNEFTKLYIWVCVDFAGDGSVVLTNFNNTALNENTVTVSKARQKQWIKLTHNLNAKIKEKMFDENGNGKEVTLFRTHFDKTPAGAPALNVYVGDIGLSK